MSLEESHKGTDHFPKNKIKILIVDDDSPSLSLSWKRIGNEVEAYFQKPFDIDEIFSSIERILGG